MKKVLILEDEVNIRSFVVINLKRAGALRASCASDAGKRFIWDDAICFRKMGKMHFLHLLCLLFSDAFRYGKRNICGICQS